VVVGSGRAGAELAQRLARRGHEVSVIDQVGAAFANLGPEFRGRTIEGEVLSAHVLRQAGIEEADGLAAVTADDSVNAVVAHAARSLFHVPNVVARNYDPRRRSMFEAFGLQVVSTTGWGAQRVEELLYHGEIRTVFSAGNGEVEVYELTIPSPWAGRRLGDLLGDQVLAVAHSRAGRARLPDPGATLHRGDVLHVSATLDGIEDLRERLGRSEAD
jgi:trk system potassium uptake protein TrkA